MAMSYFRVVVLVVHLVLIMFRLDMAKAAAAAGGGGGADECAQQLVGMATCLPYVGGEATAPTPDCCSGLKQVLSKNKKCLCVIIQERNDPDLGLQINVTLALGLPSVCNAPANVSQCPELLHLDPKSPEAQVFFQLQNNSTQIANNLAPSPSAGNDDPVRGIGVGSNSSSSGVAPQNHGGLLRWKDWSSSWGFTSVLIMVLPMFI